MLHKMHLASLRTSNPLLPDWILVFKQRSSRLRAEILPDVNIFIISGVLAFSRDFAFWTLYHSKLSDFVDLQANELCSLLSNILFTESTHWNANTKIWFIKNYLTRVNQSLTIGVSILGFAGLSLIVWKFITFSAFFSHTFPSVDVTW